MNQLKQIAEGYINLAISGTIIASEKIEELSKARMKVCESCIDFDKIGASCKLEIHRILKYGCCKHCGCYQEAKTRVLNAVCGDKENPKW
jgi:hypothetical protein